MLEQNVWKKKIEQNVERIELWKKLSERRGWVKTLFRATDGENQNSPEFYRQLYPTIIRDIQNLELSWQTINHQPFVAETDCG
jgi:hypothetical protein